MMNNLFCLRQLLRSFAWTALAAWLLIAGSAVRADPQFLDAAQAFQLRAAPGTVAGQVTLAWDIAPGYYLYRDRITVAAPTGQILGKVARPAGERKDDPNFGMVEVYHDRVAVQVDTAHAEALDVGWQGCAEAGLCYPPQRQTVSLAGLGSASVSAAVDEADPPGFWWSEGAITKLLQTGALWWTVPVFFLLGVAMTFTPCVLPMVPIVSSMVVGSQAAPRRAFVLTLAFVVAMALVYAGLGIAAALAGAGLQGLLQNQWAILGMAALFVVLALAMFGFFELQLPAALRDRLAGATPQGGSVAGAAGMGALSALLVSPCMTAPLAGALLYIAQTGSVAEGGLLLLAMGFGMGVPLLVIGAAGARYLPRPGVWMNRVKAVFGFVLLAMAAWLAGRVVAPSTGLLLWGMLAGGLAVALWSSADAIRTRVLVRSMGMVLGFWSAAMVLGAAAGGTDPLRPLGVLARAPAEGRLVEPAEADIFETVRDPQLLRARLSAAGASGRPALVDFSAQWCTSCKTIEREVFGNSRVREALRGTVLLRADVTDGNAAQLALMREHQVMGPPTVMLFDGRGRERRDQRLIGEFSADQLLGRLLPGAPS